MERPPTRTMNGTMRRPPVKRPPAVPLPAVALVVLALLAVGGYFALFHGGASSSPPTPSVAATPASRVAHLAATHAVLVFSKSYCPYCRRAKATLAAAVGAIPGAPPPHVVELDELPGGEGAALQAALAARTGRRTVPNVWVGGVPVGGGDEVAALDAGGELGELLRKAHAGGRRR